MVERRNSAAGAGTPGSASNVHPAGTRHNQSITWIGACRQIDFLEMGAD